MATASIRRRVRAVLDERAERGRFAVEAAVFAALGAVAFAVWFFGFRETRRPNVILISIDTLRADHLGCYGYGPDTSPNIDALAASGVRFARVHSSTTWTLPAHVSLMTGMPDQVHGVRHDTFTLDPERRVLAEEFRRAGYLTAGFFGGPYLAREFGFGRGFQRYENCGAPTMQEVERAHGDVTQAEFASHRVITAERIETRAEQFLESVGDQPFFLFLHHWDVHYDYRAPEEYVRRFAPDYHGTLDASAFMRNPEIHAGMSDDDLRWVIAHYDAEIRWVDYHVGRLLARLDELGLREHTYVVVTSDHGEEFFEHGNKGHRQNLYEETLRIPLVIAGPGIEPRVVEEQARIFDVMPTLLELTGLPPVPECYGVSLVPLIRGEPDATTRDLHLIAELTHIPIEITGDGELRAGDDLHHHEAFGSGSLKYIHYEKRDFRDQVLDGRVLERRDLLFDLSRDPREQDPLPTGPDAPEAFRDMTALREQIRERLQRWRAGLPMTGLGMRKRMDPALFEQLRQAGYLGG